MRKRFLHGLMSVLILSISFFARAFPTRAAEPRETESVAASQAFPAWPGVWFVHQAAAANIVSNWTYIDHPLTNNNPNAIFFVTQNWDPGHSGSGVYNSHPIGVWYDSGPDKWAIFNQDLAAMPVGASFNVLIPSAAAGAFVLTADAGNTVSNWTYIDNPATNNNPDARVFATQNWNPGGGAGLYNPHNIGVWYDTSVQKWAVFNQDLAAMPLNADFNILILPSEPDVFVHTANADNSVSQVTYLDNPALNGNPYALFIIEQNWNPPGGTGVYNNHAVGVWYDTFKARWSIFNQDLADMPAGAAFNIAVLTAPRFAQVHTAGPGNIQFNYTFIDNPLTNNNPNAIVFATPNWNPAGSGGVYNNHNIGVWYSSSEGKWAVFNQDLTAMPTDADFNIWLPSVDLSTFVHFSRAGNIAGNTTYIDHPLTNGNPNAVLIITPNWNPSGAPGVYNNHPVGVWYSSSEQKWAVFNQDFAAMPENTAFNVYVAQPASGALVHTASAGNISGNYTDLALNPINNQLSAILMVTPNWNPGGSGGIYDNHPIGVWYHSSAGAWSIFNQDLVAMPVGASFNVIEVSPKLYLPLIGSSAP